MADAADREPEPQITGISALTLAISDMGAALVFYEALGFERLYGGPDEAFTSLRVGEGYLNLIAAVEASDGFWGRAIFHVSDVDAFHARAVARGLAPDFAPRDAPWGERYFHIHDPDGHELSFARPISDSSANDRGG